MKRTSQRVYDGSVCLISGNWYWRKRFADGKGRAIRLSATSREDAEEEAARIYGFVPRNRRGSYADQMRALVRLGEWAKSELSRLGDAVSAPGMRLADVWKTFESRSRASRATLDTYARTWRHFAEWAEARKIAAASSVGAREAEEWSQASPPARSAKYMATIFRGAGLDASAFAALEARTPRREVEQYRRLSAAEAQTVLDALRASRGTWAAAAADMVVVGWYTGLRVADIGRLTSRQVDAEARLLRVVPAKTALRKPHPLTIPLWGLVEKVVARRAAEVGPLFPAVVNGRLVRHEVYEEFAAAFAKIEQPEGWRTSFHSLRASFVSQMDEAGVPAAITDAITGHAPQTMHGHYSHPGVAALREAVERAIAPLR